MDTQKLQRIYDKMKIKKEEQATRELEDLHDIVRCIFHRILNAKDSDYQEGGPTGRVVLWGTATHVYDSIDITMVASILKSKYWIDTLDQITFIPTGNRESACNVLLYLCTGYRPKYKTQFIHV